MKYKYSDFASVVICTYSYDLDYAEWAKVMDDSLSFYNAIVSQEEAYVFHWLNSQLNEMVSTLETFLKVENCSFFNERRNKPIFRVSSQAYISGDDFWILKSNKIANCLEFVNNIKVLPVQIDSSAYVERLVSLSNNFVPLLKAKIQEQKKVVDRIRKEYDECCADKDYILYKKIYDKYYNKKKWYSASKFKICWQLLHLFKHIVPSYNLKEIREHFYPLKV